VTTNLARAIILNVAFTFGISFFLGAVANPPTRSVSGVVETLEGKRLSSITVQLTNFGSATTSDTGEFSILLPAILEPGDPIELKVGQDWVVTSPWEGASFVPVTSTEVLHVRITRTGDKRLLTDPQLVKRIVVSVTTKLASPAEADNSVAEKAQTLGFSVDQVKSAIEEWSEKVQAPYEKGLAALYARRYAEASLYIRQSVSLSDDDQVEKYLSLFAAEYELGRYPQAEAVLVAAREIQPDNPLVLADLGETLRLQAKYQDAEQVDRLALAIYERACPNRVEVASVMNNLATVYDEQARYAEAEPLFRQSLEMCEKGLEAEGSLARVLNNLASVYVHEGKYAEAEPLFKRAIAIDEKTLGPDHPDLASHLSNLGTVYHQQGRYAEAEPLFKRALAIDEAKLGPDHPDVAFRLDNLGALYKDEKRYAEAEPLDKRALQIREKTLEPNHPLLSACLSNLATVYDDLGRYAEAEPLYKRALEISEKTQGPDHPDVAVKLANLAQLYHQEQKNAEAEVMYKRALSIDEKALRSEHPEYAFLLNNLAVLYADEGRPAEAVPLYEQALRIDERTLPEAPAVALHLRNLASALRMLCRNGEADIYEQQAAKIPGQPDYHSPIRAECSNRK